MLELLALFFLALIFAVASTTIARSKGFDGKLWFFGGLLLGPFAIAWLLIKPKVEKTIAIRLVRPSDFKKYPYCAEPIKSEIRVCTYCHQELLFDESTEHFSIESPAAIIYAPQALDILVLAMMVIAFVVIAVGCMALLKFVF